MSDSGYGQEEEVWSGEKDELLPSSIRNLLQTDESDGGGDGQIPGGKQQQQKSRVSADQRKGKNTKENDKKGGNRRKMQEKTGQILLSSIGRFRKHLEGTKNMATETIIRRSAAPFPYDGKDFGGSPSRYLCFRPPSIPPASDSPRKELGTTASADAPGAVCTAQKPKHSSHYFFMKSLIEKNEFYSPECNPHRKVTGSHAK